MWDSRAKQCSCTGIGGPGDTSQGSCQHRRESWVPRGKEESQPFQEGGLRLLPSPPSWESIPRKLTSQGFGTKINHGASPAGSPEALCSPQSSGAWPLISDGPSIFFSPFSQETSTLPSAASWQMETQERGEDERGTGWGGQGWKLLPGKPSLLRPLGWKSDAQPCLRGKCASSRKVGVVHGPDHPLCPSAPVSASTDGAPQGQGQGPACLCPEAQPLELFIQPRCESLYVGELVKQATDAMYEAGKEVMEHTPSSCRLSAVRRETTGPRRNLPRSLVLTLELGMEPEALPFHQPSRS